MNTYYAEKELHALRITPARKEGFKVVNLEKDNLYDPIDGEYNHLIFVLEGELRVSCNEYSGRILNVNKCILIPIGSDIKCLALSSCHLISLSFYILPDIYKGMYMETLCRTCGEITYMFEPLPVHKSLQKFFQLLKTYIDCQIDKHLLWDIKHEEFFLLLQLLYSPQEVSRLFHPIIGPHPRFRMEVLRHYHKVKQADELAVLLGMEERTFNRRMKEEFGLSPYQWLLKQKAKHVRFSLVETDKPFESIRKEYGFKFPGHFTRFCKYYLKQTPLRIRNEVATKKSYLFLD